MRSIWIHVGALALLGSATACKSDSKPKEDVPQATAKQSIKATQKTKPAAETGKQGSEAALSVGDPAPAVSLTLQDGKQVALSSLVGKQVVVYFYPKDDTSGCTAEAKGIRDQWEAFQTAGIQVFGVSMQNAESHQAFIDKYDLPFDLVVDDGTVTQAFGVPVGGGEYAARHTFLIGDDGKIKRIWRKVEAAEHAEQLLAAATGAAAAPPAGRSADKGTKPGGAKPGKAGKGKKGSGPS